MSKKRVFVSFDYDYDRSLKDLFIGQSRNEDSPFEVIDYSLKEEEPISKWEREAEEKIKRSDVVVVIVGKYTYRASGVKKEVKMANSNKIRIFQIKGYKDENCPSVEDAGKYYNWTWDNLKILLGS